MGYDHGSQYCIGCQDAMVIMSMAPWLRNKLSDTFYKLQRRFAITLIQSIYLNNIVEQDTGSSFHQENYSAHARFQNLRQCRGNPGGN